MAQHITHNYWNGEVGFANMNASMQMAEVMFSASDDVKKMAESGKLQSLHEKYENKVKAATSHFDSIRQNISNVILECQAKEDEVYDEAMSAYPELKLTKHNAQNNEVPSFFTRKAFRSIDNLAALDKLKDKQQDKTVLRNYHEQLHALLEVHVKALENLISLQEQWIINVENDSVTQNELSHFKEKVAAFKKVIHEHHDSAEATMLLEHLKEANANAGEAKTSFESFKASHEERNRVYSNFKANGSQEVLTNFRQKLLIHLSQSIVVKENRNRYQQEQYDRLVKAQSSSDLSNRG